jgi:hypothetical protein
MWMDDVNIVSQQSKYSGRNNYFLQRDNHPPSVSPNSKIIQLENGVEFHVSYEYINKNKIFMKPKTRVYSETRSFSTNM